MEHKVSKLFVCMTFRPPFLMDSARAMNLLVALCLLLRPLCRVPDVLICFDISVTPLAQVAVSAQNPCEEQYKCT